MANPQKNEFNQEKKNRNDDIQSQSGETATQVNKTQELQSQQGREPGLRNVKNEENLDREKMDEEDDEIIGERESQEESRVKNFKDSGSEARR